MKNRYILAALSLALLPLLPSQPVHAEATPAPTILIAALQTGQEGSAGNDFVVLHNTTYDAIDVTGWKMQYRAASSTGSSGWATKRTLACVPVAPACTVRVPARTNIVLATYDISGVERQPLTSGFSDGGGQVRLVRPSALAGQFDVVDTVGYGNAAEAEGNAAPAPQAGQVLVRRQTAQYELIDTNSNSADFSIGCYTITISEVPAAMSCEAPVTELPEETPQEPDVSPVNEVPEPPVAYPDLLITELFPDPVSPATDSADEFIELHNPGSQPVSIKDYMVQAGSDFRYQYSLGDAMIPAGGYIAIYSIESHLSLANSGTAVRLLDPRGIVLNIIASYGQAKPGQAWAKGANGWQWTLTSTPGAPNVMQLEVPKPAVLAAAAAVKKAVTSKKAATSAPKPPKAVAPKAAKTVAGTSGSAQAANSKPQDSGTIQYWVLGGIGALILGYAIYEYRQDIARFVRKVTARIPGRKKSSEAGASTLQTD